MTTDSDSVGDLARLCGALAKAEGPQEPARPASGKGRVFFKSPQINVQESWCDFAVVFQIDEQGREWISKDLQADLSNSDPMTRLEGALGRLNLDAGRVFKQCNTSKSNPIPPIFLVSNQRGCIVEAVKATVAGVAGEEGVDDEETVEDQEVAGKLTFQGLIRFPSSYHQQRGEPGPAAPDVGIAIVRLEYQQHKGAQTLDSVLAINLKAREQAKKMVQGLVPIKTILREPYAHLVVRLSTEFQALFDHVWQHRKSKTEEEHPPLPPRECADINRLLDLQAPAPLGPKENDDDSREWLAERLYYQTTPGGGGVCIAYDYNSGLTLFAKGHKETAVNAGDLSLYQFQVMHQLYVRAVAEVYSERLSERAASSEIETAVFATMQGQMQSFVNAYDFPFLSSGRIARELYKLARRAMVIETHLRDLHEAVRATAEYHNRREGIEMAKRSEEMAKRSEEMAKHSGRLAMGVAAFALLSLWTGFFGMNTLDGSGDMCRVVELFGSSASYKSCLPDGKGSEALQSPALGSGLWLPNALLLVAIEVLTFLAGLYVVIVLFKKFWAASRKMKLIVLLAVSAVFCGFYFFVHEIWAALHKIWAAIHSFIPTDRR